MDTGLIVAALIVTGLVIAATVATAIAQAAYLCQSCGKELGPSARACHSCGAKGAAAYGPVVYLPVFLLFLVGLLALGVVWFLEIRDR